MNEPSTPIYQDQLGNLPDIKVEKLILEWTSPSRPYKARSREFYTTIGSIAFLLGVIILLMGDFLLIGVIISFAFLSYVLASHKPESVTHQLTTKGIRAEGILHPWESMTSFWLKKQWDQEMVVCRTKTLPGVIMLVIDEKTRESIIKTIGDHLELVMPTDTFVDRASRWLSEKIPLENK